MLKKKMQSLVHEKNLSIPGKFEIVTDPSASIIYGGAVSAPKSCAILNDCGTYTGTCPNLVSCGSFN